jgi:hypothetical protein
MTASEIVALIFFQIKLYINNLLWQVNNKYFYWCWELTKLVKSKTPFLGISYTDFRDILSNCI